MSIDARIIGVTYLPDGTARLVMEPRQPHGHAGQSSFIVLDPPQHLDGMIGSEVWGGDSWLMCGDTKIADRIGYSTIRFVGRGASGGGG